MGHKADNQLEQISIPESRHILQSNEGAKVSEKSFTDDRKETLGQSHVQHWSRIVELERPFFV